jgi:hypothetical protein
MNSVERVLVGSLSVGVWALVVMHAITNLQAQEKPPAVPNAEPPIQTIHATDIIGLSAFVQQAVRDHQFRPQSMPGLDQHIRSVVRNCRVNGSISDGRLTATSLSC